MQKNQQKGGNMKHFVQNLILVIILTILLLFSYAFLQKKLKILACQNSISFFLNSHRDSRRTQRKMGRERKRASRRKTERTIHIGQSGSAIWNLMPTAVL